MNQIATDRRRSHRPTILASLNLADEGQRRLHGLIQRMHGGRWPTLRALGMRQVGGALYEAAEWPRMRGNRYSLIEWYADGLGLRIRGMPDRDAALAALRALP